MTVEIAGTMKILHVTDTYVPRLGGIEVRGVAQALPVTVLWSSVSRVAADALRTVTQTDVEVLPNGFALDAGGRAAPGTDPTPTIVSVMRLARRKRPRQLIDILAAVAARLE